AAATRSALAAALGSAPPVVLALAREVTRSMTTHAIPLGVLALVAGGLLAAGGLWVSGHTSPAAVPETGEAPAGGPRALDDHKGYVYAASYAPDGRRFVSVGNGTAIVWDAEPLRKLF